MKFNSYILSILIVLAVVALAISAASAVNLVNNENFVIDIPSGSNFTGDVATNISAGDVNMFMSVFENSGNNSDDVNTIVYLKDLSSGKTFSSNFIKDLRKDNEILEETDKYIVLKTKDSTFNFDIGNDIDSVFSFAENLFSAEDISVSSDGSSVSLSDEGLKVYDGNGENVSISGQGIIVFGEDSSSGNSLGNVNVSVEGDVNPHIHDDAYAVYLNNSDNSNVIVISGNNLDLLKQMAETVNFTGN